MADVLWHLYCLADIIEYPDVYNTSCFFNIFYYVTLITIKTLSFFKYRIFHQTIGNLVWLCWTDYWCNMCICKGWTCFLHVVLYILDSKQCVFYFSHPWRDIYMSGAKPKITILLKIILRKNKPTLRDANKLSKYLFLKYIFLISTLF